jgi:hypothetical protein
MNTDRETKARLLWFLLGCIGLFILVALIDPWSVFRQPFRTQTILFRDMAAPEHRVEFQMQDVGALGYNRQVVEIRPFMFFFETSVPFDSTLNSNTKWVRVNEEVNELGIRYP